MWPECTNNLIPFRCEIEPYLPEFLEKEWKQVTLGGQYAAPFPIRLTSLLGKCSTGDYPDCPTLPEHHIRNARSYHYYSGADAFTTFDNAKDYLDENGRYYWLDFDFIWHPSTSLQLRIPLSANELMYNNIAWNRASASPMRMVINIGDADCNDGFWGVIWHRLTGEKVANLEAWGGDETTVRAVSQDYISLCEKHFLWTPVSLCKRINTMDRMTLRLANGKKLEKLICLAIDLWSWYRDRDSTKDYQRRAAIRDLKMGKALDDIIRRSGLSLAEVQALQTEIQ